MDHYVIFAGKEELTKTLDIIKDTKMEYISHGIANPIELAIYGVGYAPDYDVYIIHIKSTESDFSDFCKKNGGIRTK